MLRFCIGFGLLTYCRYSVESQQSKIEVLYHSRHTHTEREREIMIEIKPRKDQDNGLSSFKCKMGKTHCESCRYHEGFKLSLSIKFLNAFIGARKMNFLSTLHRTSSSLQSFRYFSLPYKIFSITTGRPRSVFQASKQL